MWVTLTFYLFLKPTKSLLYYEIIIRNLRLFVTNINPLLMIRLIVNNSETTITLCTSTFPA